MWGGLREQCFRQLTRLCVFSRFTKIESFGALFCCAWFFPEDFEISDLDICWVWQAFHMIHSRALINIV